MRYTRIFAIHRAPIEAVSSYVLGETRKGNNTKPHAHTKEILDSEVEIKDAMGRKDAREHRKYTKAACVTTALSVHLDLIRNGNLPSVTVSIAALVMGCATHPIIAITSLSSGIPQEVSGSELH